MADITQLSPQHVVEIPAPEVYEAEVIDDAVRIGDPVRCVIPSGSALLATDPLGWMPFPTKAGPRYPRKGDRALVGTPEGGPQAILSWEPKHIGLFTSKVLYPAKSLYPASA